MKGHYQSHFAAHHQATGGAFKMDDLFHDDDFFGGQGFMNVNEVHTRRSHHQKRTQHCHTVTKRVNNMVTTYTTCS